MEIQGNKGFRKKVKVKRNSELIRIVELIESKTTTQAVGCKRGWSFRCEKTPVSPHGSYMVPSAERAKGMRHMLELLKGYRDFMHLLGRLEPYTKAEENNEEVPVEDETPKEAEEVKDEKPETEEVHEEEDKKEDSTLEKG